MINLNFNLPCTAQVLTGFSLDSDLFSKKMKALPVNQTDLAKY